ncbi:hypothetical protein [Roseospira goensis]|uniref:Glycoside-hydrolase family GH114 TIM-barrel domain-containing protein n=1 Tax=Roseospira goensis TaxID=391922 RepID=A0A7W6RWX4_9PROT|nr:hypothetical protein [Roseospira goensis]MBB4284677.1 hypothetical protein [Roseospira goensis]
MIRPLALALIAVLSVGLSAAPAGAADPAPPAPGAGTGPGTDRLMEQMRDLGLAPEQEGMDPQGLYDPGERPGLMDRYRREREAREAARAAERDPGEPLLVLPPTMIPDFRAELRLIVRELARYARARDPNFAVLARGGATLAFRTRREAVLEAARAAAGGLGAVDPDSPAAGVGEPAGGFLGAVDGLVLDGQFCGEPPIADDRLARLADMGLRLVSVEHCADRETAAEARRRARAADVLIHVDTAADGRLDTVPVGRPWGENPDNITDPAQARSILWLETAAGYGDASLLIGALRDTNHDMLVLNPFLLGGVALGEADVQALRYKKLGARRLVLATFDVAFAHEDAYYWEPDWRLGAPRWLSATARDRTGAYFTEYWDPAWKALLGDFFVAVMDLGFDGVVLDGLDAVHRWEAITPVE